MRNRRGLFALGIMPEPDFDNENEGQQNEGEKRSGAEPLTPEKVADIVRGVMRETRGEEGGGSGRDADRKPQRFTRSQLDQFIEQGRITEAQRDDILDRQRTDEIADRVLKVIEPKLDARKPEGELDEYARLPPDLVAAGTPLRKKAEAEFKKLVETLGKPADEAAAARYELLAARAAAGDLAALRRRAQDGGRRESMRETHDDGDDDGRDRGGKEREDAAPRSLSPREKSFYEGQIAKGLYGGWKDVRAEMKFARDDIRSKARARFG